MYPTPTDNVQRRKAYYSRLAAWIRRTLDSMKGSDAVAWAGRYMEASKVRRIAYVAWLAQRGQLITHPESQAAHELHKAYTQAMGSPLNASKGVH